MHGSTRTNSLPTAGSEPMRVLVGADVQPICEVEKSLSDFGSRYSRLLFSDRELETCGATPSRASRLTAHFAAKEAVLKILDTSEIVPTWRSIEVKNSRGGQPEIVLHDDAAVLATLQGVEHIFVSLSYAGGVAAATVIATIKSESEDIDK
jgi:holo-[acyl-carrier protein] synthase